MENQKSSMKQVMFTYGVYLGLATILINVINYAVGDTYDPESWVQILGILVSIVFTVLALKQFRSGNEGLMSLGQALKIGVGASLISGVIYIIYMLVFTSVIEPNFYLNMEEVQYQKLLEQYPNWSDEQLEAAKENLSAFSGSGASSAIILIFSIFFGFVISLIAGLIMKQNRPEH